MTFVAPLWLAAAGLVGAGVVFAHLFTNIIPPQDVLPTVRFIPASTPLTVMRSRRVSDVPLLLLRLAAVALLGLALSGAHVATSAPARVVLMDASRATASLSAAADSALAAADGAPIIGFDSVARIVSRDSVKGLTVSGARGSLSAALVAAHRAVAGYSDGRDRTELVIVSPLAREEVDSATTRLLSLWDGPVRVVPVAMARAPAAGGWDVRATGDDPVVAALSRMPRRGTVGVRVVRALPTRADSQWAQAGGALVIWPAGTERAVLVPRAAPDSQGGIVAGNHVAVAGFVRAFSVRPGRALVRWMDGEPAATERALGRGCVREVAVPVDPVGDLPLRESFRAIAASLLEPCGGSRDFALASVIPSRSAGGVILSRGAAKDLAFQAQGTDADSLPLWLAVLAAGVLVAEQFLRGRGRRAVA